jgi:mannose-6-phosphate isomerase-like protein (cupin superfamily)
MSEDGLYGVLLERGSMELGFYRPGDTDLQNPHERDEIYIVQRGNGTFFMDGHRQPFEAGEALFVPAGVTHRFEDYSDDFCAWVIFYGPVGGEEP